MRVKYLALLMLVSIAFLGTTVSRAHGQYCGLTNRVTAAGSNYPGGTFTVTSTYTNTGNDAIQITGITLTTDFGTFSAPASGLPLSLPVGSTQSSSIDVQVPSSTSVGNHPVTSSTSFQCNASGTWVTPSFSPLVISGNTLPIVQNPIISEVIGLVILGVIVALAVAVVVLVRRSRKRKQAEQARMPTYMPPPPPPPASQPPAGQ